MAYWSYKFKQSPIFNYHVCFSIWFYIICNKLHCAERRKRERKIKINFEANKEPLIVRFITRDILGVRVQWGTDETRAGPNCFQKGGGMNFCSTLYLSNVCHANYRESRSDTLTHFDVSFDYICISNLDFHFFNKFKCPRPEKCKQVTNPNSSYFFKIKMFGLQNCHIYQKVQQTCV